MYQLLYGDNNKINAIKNLATGWMIPMDEANTDYQTYLKWVAEGNTPDPAENT
jgi:hypothetical protein